MANLTRCVFLSTQPTRIPPLQLNRLSPGPTPLLFTRWYVRLVVQWKLHWVGGFIGKFMDFDAPPLLIKITVVFNIIVYPIQYDLGFLVGC